MGGVRSSVPSQAAPDSNASAAAKPVSRKDKGTAEEEYDTLNMLEIRALCRQLQQTADYGNRVNQSISVVHQNDDYLQISLSL